MNATSEPFSTPASTPAGRGSPPAETSLVILAVLAIGTAFTVLGPVLKPFLVAVFVFQAIQFGVKLLVGLGLRRFTAFTALFGLVLIASILLAQFVLREAETFRASWPRYEERVVGTLGQWLRGSFRGEESFSDMFRITSQDILNFVFSHSLDVAELITLVFCYLIFLFAGSRRLEGRIRRGFPGERGEQIVAIGQGISRSMEQFMVVKTATGLGMAVTAGLLMAVCGLDHWLLWAFLFFIANYITYIGSMAACVPPILLAFLDFSSPVSAVCLGVGIILVRTFWIDYFEVRASGKQLNLDSTLLFLWLSYWGWAWGIMGLILAYPMMAAVRIILEHVGGLAGWAVVLGEE